MAKASAQITISRIVDISSVTRYYLLQSSTSAAPSKPTANPPGGSWTTTEPTYTSGSTNTLYFVDLTVFTNSTFSYSAVSKSSSYEAAKAAYNKADTAQSTANSAQSTANTALSQSIEYIVGTQTAATNAWKGVTTDAALSVGKTIAYKLPYAGNSSAATLNLTLSGGGTTGAKGIRRLTSTVTTNYAAESVVLMTYDGTYWRITDYNSDTYDRVRYNKAIKCGTTAIVAANIIVGTGGLYKHLKAGTAFDVTYPILYASSAIAASATGTNNYLCYSFTVTTTQSITLTAYKPVYIKGTLSGTTFTPISTAPLTQTVPTSDDGYYYILLGHAITSTTMYLLSEHPIYKYFNGKFMSVTQIAIEASKSATDYMKFTSGDGLVVGDMTTGTLGKNVRIDSDSVDIRDGTTVAASFSASSINLCDNAGYIYARGYDDTNVFDSLEIGSRNIDIVAPNTYMRTHSRVNSNGYANSVIQATTGNIISGDSYAGDYSLASISSNSKSENVSHASVSTTAFADHADASSVNINAVSGSIISNIEVTPTNIKLKTGAGEIVADSSMVFNQFTEFMGDVLFNDGFESDGSVKFNVGSQYVQFETDGSYPGIATANYIRTPTSGIIPKTSGGSGSVGTSGWPFNSGYFNNLYVNGTAVSVSGHTHSYLPLSGGTVTGTLYLNNNTDASGAADNNVPLIIGNRAGNHLIIDANEIIAKSSGTAVTKLYLQDSGGYVYIGNDRVLPHKMLYSGSTTGTVTLTETAANFLYLIIIVGFSDTGSSGTICVYSPNGKTVDAHAVAVSSNSASVGRVRYVISGTTMTASNNYLAKSTNSSWSYSQNGVYCKAVIGFR